MILLILGYLGYGTVTHTINDATRVNVSEHVSNIPCGSAYNVVGEGDDCPGELKCFEGPSDGNYNFDSERLGANVSGARCVTPTYVERYCGIFEGRRVLETYPPNIECGSLVSSTPYLAPIKVLYNEPDLLNRVFNTDRDGVERIRSHGLKLAIEDPDASDLEGTGFVDCHRGDIKIQEARYESLPRQVTVTVQNTGSIPLRNVTAHTLIDYENRSTLNRPQVQNTTRLGTLQPGDTVTGRFTVNSTPERLEVLPQDCAMLEKVVDDIPGT
jgi:archaellum component FlaF (FlaF/FlaG flagellin family)